MDRRPPSCAARFAGVLCLVAAALVAGLGPASAQGWFGGIFGGSGFGGGRPGSYQQQPNYPGYDYGGPSRGANDEYLPHHRLHRHAKPQAQATRPTQHQVAAPAEKTAPPPKTNASAFVYVFGDSFGQFLANGLDEALADRADVAVVHKARGSSSIVNKDFYDWPKAIDTLLAGKDKIDVAVMMIGSNDRQPITQDGKTYDVGSDDWKRIYKDRVMAIDEAFRKKNIPLIWVGVPITKSSDFADTMAALNDITRDAAAKTGATFVDTWEAFSDDNGDFAAYGPDINGQTVRLRSSDGILFTHAGARKLAHFVEAPIRRALDGKTPAPVLPTGPEAQGKTPDAAAGDRKAQGGKQARDEMPKPVAGPIVNLNQVPSADKGELAAPTAFNSSDGVLAKGDPDATPVGRADDARWPADGKTP